MGDSKGKFGHFFCTLFIASFLLTLSACTGGKGNGEGVGTPIKNTPTEPEPGSNYYPVGRKHQDGNAPIGSCTNDDGTTTLRQSITYLGNGKYQFTQNCPKIDKIVNKDQIQLSHDAHFLLFENFLFEKFDSPPSTLEYSNVIILCLGEQVEVAIRSNRNAELSVQTGGNWSLTQSTVQYSYQAPYSIYQSSDFILKVDRFANTGNPANPPNLLELFGKPVQAIPCRMLNN